MARCSGVGYKSRATPVSLGNNIVRRRRVKVPRCQWSGHCFIIIWFPAQHHFHTENRINASDFVGRVRPMVLSNSDARADGELSHVNAIHRMTGYFKTELDRGRFPAFSALGGSEKRPV
jgi:hypothetical protein